MVRVFRATVFAVLTIPQNLGTAMDVLFLIKEGLICGFKDGRRKSVMALSWQW